MDDIHLLEDLNAAIQAGVEGASAGLPPRALLVSSLRAAAPVSLLLNASLDDQADLVTRQCGCPMDGHGWTEHLHAVRSFEKLTAGDMTFLDTDVIRAIEEVPPARFGGGPLDSPLVEDGPRTADPSSACSYTRRSGRPILGRSLRRWELIAWRLVLS